jgi:hypothetical protein
VDGPPRDPGLELGGPGTYRVRVARNHKVPDGYTWLLRFWLDEPSPHPPRWLARKRAPVEPTSRSWVLLLGFDVRSLLAAVQQAAGDGGITLDELAATEVKPFGGPDGGNGGHGGNVQVPPPPDGGR